MICRQSYQLIRPSRLLASLDTQPQFGAPGTGCQDGACSSAGLSVPAALTGSSRSGADRRRLCGRGVRPRTWPEGWPPPGPHSAPPARSPPPAHLACLDVLPPLLQKRGSALLGPVQPFAGRVAAGYIAARATQIHSSRAEGVGKCGKVPGEVESCAAVAWHSEGHNSASGADVLTACPPQGKDTNL